jgi:hypothetical protein
MTSYQGTAMLAVAAVMAFGCSTPTAPEDPDTLALGRSITTEAFEYRFSADDVVSVDWQEAYHQWAIAELDVTPRRIRYNKYLSREHMRAHTGTGNANAFANPDRYEIHTIWSSDNHEVVHLYSLEWGRTVALWSEGLAVSYQVDPARGIFVPRWSGVPLDDRARQFLQDGRLIPISDLLTTADFRRFDPNVTYPEAGSFMLAIRSTCGLEGVRRLFRSGAVEDSAESVRQKFVAACGRTIDDLEAGWRAMLASGTAQQEQRR